MPVQRDSEFNNMARTKGKGGTFLWETQVHAQTSWAESGFIGSIRFSRGAGLSWGSSCSLEPSRRSNHAMLSSEATLLHSRADEISQWFYVFFRNTFFLTDSDTKPRT